MVKPTTQKKDNLSQKETPEKRFPVVSFEYGPNDELIASLANAYENRRARQVNEWELLRRKAFRATV